MNTDEVFSASDYCRSIEAYLCRKNDGHLIRIVGPAFEQVCGWGTRGIPLKIVFAGIDRYFERYYAKGPRRRPVRVEFCDADVLDVFDDWRRAVGVHRAASDGHDDEVVATKRHGGLPAHLERVVARLTSIRGGADRGLDETIDTIVRELDAARAESKTIRGERRERLLERLRVLDRELLTAMRGRCTGETLQQLAVEAEEELSAFRDRMPRDAYERSREACIDRLIRERMKAPTLTFE